MPSLTTFSSYHLRELLYKDVFFWGEGGLPAYAFKAGGGVMEAKCLCELSVFQPINAI